MVLDPIAGAVDPSPAALTIAPVASDDVDDYMGVIAEGFDAPFDIVERVFRGPLLHLGGFTALLGRLNGVPVATSGLWCSDGVAGVYNVATLPGHRAKGYGAAMTWAAANLGRDAGLTQSILQASAAGEPVCERMGYRTLVRYRQFEGPARK